MEFRLILNGHALRGYNLHHLAGDMTAGTITAILFVPQAMAYANLVEAPLIMGLYAATLPLLVFALFGSSRYLSVGPVSIVSLLTLTGIQSLAAPHSEQFLIMVSLVALLAGLMQLLMSLLRVGSMLALISPAVLDGFIAALAVIIMIYQLPLLLGMPRPEEGSHILNLKAIIQLFPGLHTIIAVIGITGLLFLLLCKRYFPSIPGVGPFVLLLASSVIVEMLHLHAGGVRIVGSIPRTLPDFSLKIADPGIIISLVPTASMVAFISSLESFSIAKSLADKENETLHINQDLTGLGLANAASAFIGGIPVAGGISRTAVNYEAGAQTRMAGAITSIMMILVIFFITPLLYYLPYAALAAIIVVAMIKLLHIGKLQYYFKHAPMQGIIFLVTFICTFAVHIVAGLITGMALSVIWEKWIRAV